MNLKQYHKGKILYCLLLVIDIWSINQYLINITLIVNKWMIIFYS